MSCRFTMLTAAAAGVTLALVPAGPAAAQVPDTVVDVHFNYTQERENNYGGRNETLAIMKAAQGLMNRAHAESGTGIQYNYVLPTKVNYNADSSTNNALSDLRFNRIPGIHGRRDRLGTDMIAINASIRAAGVAYTTYRQTFAVRFLSGPATAHEVGHTLGCGHGGIAGDGGQGDRGYARGWAFRDAGGKRFGTVMTGAQIVRFSSPRLTFRGRTIGIANKADNLRRIRETRREQSRIRNLNPAAAGAGQRWYVRTRAGGQALESEANRRNNGTNIKLWPFRSSAPHHAWNFENAPTGGFVKLRNASTRGYLDVAGVSRATSANVQQWGNNGSRGNQELRVRGNGAGFHKFQFRHSGHWLTAVTDRRGANVVQRLDRGLPTQDWWLTSPY